MKKFISSFDENPSLDTVNDLTNTIFNPDQIVEGRMATEDQVKQLEERYNEVEAIRDYCCRDIVVWKTFTRVVSSQGNVLSNFIDNIVTGTTRRGMPFTVTFSPKFDENIYALRSSYRLSTGSWEKTFCILYTDVNTTQDRREKFQYILLNSSSVFQNPGTVSSTMDVCEVLPGDTNCTILTNLISNSSRVTPNNYDLTANPLPYENTYFKLYIQNDGTITIDVKFRGFFRGVTGFAPNDPAYLMIFVLDLVRK